MKNEILELTQKLISYKTITGNQKEIIACFDFINRYFSPEIKAQKIIAKKYEKNGHISLVFSNTNKTNFNILLNGHIDVVAANHKEFISRIKNNKLYGRGAADMKSEVALLMKVFKNSINSGIKKSMALMLTSDEEISGKSGVGYLINKIGYKSDIVIAPDGGHNFELVIKEKGGFWVKITAQGKSAHGSRPWLGENAILKLMRFYQELQKNFPALKKTKNLYQDGISLNMGKIQGGKNTNSVPDKAEMYLDLRYSEKKDKTRILKKTKQLAKKHKLTSEIIDRIEMLETNPQNPYLIKFIKIAEKIINRKIKISKATGASDARFFSANNIPVIIMTPNCGNKHSKNEWVNINSLDKFYRILKEYIQSV